jgi:hypothetical protein
MDLLVRLRFNNRTSSKCSAEIITKRSSCQRVSEWYASHHAGDDFTIYIDGQRQKQNSNGEIDE